MCTVPSLLGLKTELGMTIFSSPTTFSSSEGNEYSINEVTFMTAAPKTETKERN